MITYIIFSLFGLTVAVIFFLNYYFSSKKKILRRLKQVSFSRIGSLQNNKFAKIEGLALNIEDPLIAPLSKRKCVYYKIKIEKKVSSGKNSRWETIVDQKVIQDFFVEQTGERLIILPTVNKNNYYDYLVTDRNTSSGTFNDPTPGFKALLEYYNIESETFFGFNKQLRYSEAILEVGEPVTVAGHVKWIKLEDPVKDYNYSRIASLTAKPKDKILITDSPDALRPKFGRA